MVQFSVWLSELYEIAIGAASVHLSKSEINYSAHQGIKHEQHLLAHDRSINSPFACSSPPGAGSPAAAHGLLAAGALCVVTLTLQLSRPVACGRKSLNHLQAAP